MSAQRLPWAGLVFIVAGAFDLATGQRCSQVWGSLALIVASWVLLPALRRVGAAIAAYASVWVSFNSARAFADDVPWRDRTVDRVAAIESTLAGRPPGARLQEIGVALPGIFALEWTLLLVYLSYFVIPHAVALALFVRRRADFWRFLGASACLFAIGVLAFAAVPSAPPWLASDGEVERVVPRVLGGHAADRAYDFDPNPVASLPSIHLGITALLVPVAWRGAQRMAAIGYLLAMALALVFLGEHHVTDVVTGSVVALAAWRLTRGLTSPPALRKLGVRRRMSPRMRSFG